MLLEISQNWQENTCASLFFNEVSGFRTCLGDCFFHKLYESCNRHLEEERTKSAILMNFCIANTPGCRILICVCKIFHLFQTVKRLKVILKQDRKLLHRSIFHCQDILKNELSCPLSTPRLVYISYVESYYDFKIFTSNIQRMTYFIKGSLSSRAIFKSI